MAKKETLTRSSMLECKNCSCPVGERETGASPKVLPFRVDGGNNDYETFCPCCFVYKRAPLEPGRFTPGAFAPVHCGNCGWDSVATGLLKCILCGNHHVLLLPPKIAS